MRRAFEQAAELFCRARIPADAGHGIIAAIGDVHGRADLLETMLAELHERIGPSDEPMAVFFLGDIVDRGPDSRLALDLVCRELASQPASRLFLGNHDDWLLRFLEGELDKSDVKTWREQGGSETLASYGVSAEMPAKVALAKMLKERPEHLQVLRSASTIETRGAYAFAHAGVDPKRPMDRQRREDCLWIRGPFQRHVGRLSHIVVHGHQPQKGGLPVVTENRISMDTGAVFSDRLSAVVIDLAAGTLVFLQAGPDGDVRTVSPRKLDRGLGTVLDALPSRLQPAGLEG